MRRLWVVGAALWGAAEATFFFIVPDVLLTAAVLKLGWRAALKLAGVAAAAAVLAGSALYLWAAADASGARAAMLLVPAVGPDLIVRTTAEIDGLWPLHMLAGAISGVPYKLYAVAAGTGHIGLIPFVLASFAARLARFALAVGIVTAVGHGLDRLDSARLKVPLLVAGWIVLYAVYFGLRAGA